MRLSCATFLGLAVSTALALPDAASADVHADRVAAVKTAYQLSEWLKLVKPEEAGHVQGMSKKPQACLDALAAMTKEGRADDDKLGLYPEMTIASARAMCEKTLVDARAFENAVTGREGGKRSAVEKKFKDAGAKGDRFKLFVDNELSGFPWYASGCETEVTDAKDLARAKVLFQWTNGKSGGTLVSKYTFAGDTYKVSARELFTEAKAYASCK